jgi:pimeloyl-ACP methyl ester carboxylesterase
VDFSTLKRLDVPVVMMIGRHDTTTSARLASRWTAELQSPSKSIVWFEHSAHLPMIEEPGRFLLALVEHVRVKIRTVDD